jgi:hypothetical protein
MAKFTFTVATNKVGSDVSRIVEVDDEDLEGRTPAEREEVIKQYFEDWIWNNIDTSWQECE